MPRINNSAYYNGDVFAAGKGGTVHHRFAPARFSVDGLSFVERRVWCCYVLPVAAVITRIADAEN